MPVPPPSKDIEDALLGLAAILDRAVEQVHRVIAEVKQEEAAGGGNEPQSGKAGQSDDI